MLSLWILSQLMLIGISPGDAVYNGPEQLSPEAGELPYMVQILDLITTKKVACGGAIIDPTHILTAAHCLITAQNERLIIVAGVVDLLSDCRIQQQGVAEIFIHDKFAVNGTLWHQVQSTRWNRIQKWFRDTLKWSNYAVYAHIFEYDIAVLKLNKPLPIGNNIKPINLPSPDSSPICYTCTFAGWGQIEINGPTSLRLYATQLIVLPPRECEVWRTRVDSNELCAVHPDGQSMPLNGDSGAPLVFDNTVYGIVSSSGNDPRYPSIFTKVSAHLKWIRKVSKK